MENPTHTFRYMNLVLHTSYDNCDIEEKLDVSIFYNILT